MVKCAGWAKVRGDWESVVGVGRKGLDERGGVGFYDSWEF